MGLLGREIGSIGKMFFKNLYAEYSKTKYLPSYINNTCNRISEFGERIISLKSSVLPRIYPKPPFDKNKTILKPSTATKLFEKYKIFPAFDIDSRFSWVSQYYGGTSFLKTHPERKVFLPNIRNYLYRLLDRLDFIHNYFVLNEISEKHIGNILKDVFSFKENSMITPEGLNSLKTFRKEVLTDKKIKIVDIRKIRIDKIEIKNLKKTIYGYLELDIESNSSSFICNFQMVKYDGTWKLDGFECHKC